MEKIDLKRKRNDMEDEENYLSDESDFYGSASVKASYNKQARTFDPSEYWSSKHPSLLELAHANRLIPNHENQITPYNPYEGRSSGRQLSETVTQFLARLPPKVTPVAENLPWIYIANPFRKRPAHVTSNSINIESESVTDQDEEGAMARESNWRDFVVKGLRLLEEMTRLRHDIEKENFGKAKATISRKLNPLKEELVQKILTLAVDLKCTSGKWLIFCETSEVNQAWSLVANATANGELGSAAKVAPDSGGDPRKPRLICVYNDDFTDIETVKRVVTKLKEFGLVGQKGGIYYKCCAYTYLRLNRDNEYGIKTSLYSSTEILANGKDKPVKVDLLYKKKKTEDEWKALEDANPWSF